MNSSALLKRFSYLLITLNLATYPISSFAGKVPTDLAQGVAAEQREPQQPAIESDQATAEVQNVVANPKFEISPTAGALFIQEKLAFSLGAFTAFQLVDNTGFYVEPAAIVTIMPGDTNANATLFHLDGGVRYNLGKFQRGLVPFARVGLGISMSTNSSAKFTGETLPSSYLHLFAGGGAKIAINSDINARVDMGYTIQNTNAGAFLLGAVALAL